MKTIVISIGLFLGILTTKAMAQEFEVKVTGRGKPVLLFPGFASTRAVYKEIIGELSKGYEVHAFTFAGFGGVAPISFPWLPQIKTAISAYVKKQQLNKPIIIGHSLGGSLGLWLVSTEPNSYAKLVIVDALPAMGALMIPNYKSENMVYDSPYNQQLLEMNNADFKRMAGQMASSMSLNKQVHEQLANWLSSSDRKTYVYGYTDLLKLDLRDSLSLITIPVSILVATQPYGKQTAETNYKSQYKNLKNYTLSFADNAAHFIMYDQPEWFLRQIKSELHLK